jgi:hypothetical protein
MGIDCLVDQPGTYGVSVEWANLKSMGIRTVVGYLWRLGSDRRCKLISTHVFVIAVSEVQV